VVAKYIYFLSCRLYLGRKTSKAETDDLEKQLFNKNEGLANHFLKLAGEAEGFKQTALNTVASLFKHIPIKVVLQLC